MVYDCTRSLTLDSIINWKTELDDRVYKRDGDALPTVLVGAKVCAVLTVYILKECCMSFGYSLQ